MAKPAKPKRSRPKPHKERLTPRQAMLLAERERLSKDPRDPFNTAD